MRIEDLNGEQGTHECYDICHEYVAAACRTYLADEEVQSQDAD